MEFMQQAFNEAVLAVGISRPNPPVGAVVVSSSIDGGLRVVGRGHTQRPGEAHAEVMALRDAGETAQGADLFVTLEPCCHYGRTPPCTKAIIEAGIKRVFFAHADPNPQVRGKSRRILEEAGVEVFEGMDACGDRGLFAEVSRFYEAYDYFVCNKATFVEIKSSVSRDGFMACVDKSPLKITGDGADAWNHELRSFSDAILIGVGTLLHDNPSLTVRLAEGNNPVKMILAGHHVFTAEEVSSLKVFAECTTDMRTADMGCPLVVLYSCVEQPAIEFAACKNTAVQVVRLPGESFEANWNAVLQDVYGRGMHRLMVEPGAVLAANLFKSGLWNRFDLWRSDDEVADGLSYPELPATIVAATSGMIGKDVLTVYYPG